MKKGKNREKSKKRKVYPKGELRGFIADRDSSLNPVGFVRPKTRDNQGFELTNKHLKEKKEISKRVLVVPESITSNRGRMLWLLESLGKSWSKVYCAKALELLELEDSPKNRKYFYDRKSEFKGSLNKRHLGSKYKKPQVSFHNFNEASLFLSVAFSLRVRGEAVKKGWIDPKARNKYIKWKERAGWIRWYPTTGRVRIHVKKPVTEGKILQLLANAFFNTDLLSDIKNFTAFYRSFYLKKVKVTHNIGKRIPPFRIEFSDGFSRMVIMNDKSHPQAIEIDYLLLKEAEEHKHLLIETQRTLNLATETNVQLMEVLKQLVQPKPLRDDGSRMVI